MNGARVLSGDSRLSCKGIGFGSDGQRGVIGTHSNGGQYALSPKAGHGHDAIAALRAVLILAIRIVVCIVGVGVGVGAGCRQVVDIQCYFRFWNQHDTHLGVWGLGLPYLFCVLCFVSSQSSPGQTWVVSVRDQTVAPPPGNFLD